MAPFTAMSPTSTDQLSVGSPLFDQKLSGRGRTISASSTSFRRRLIATPIVIVLMLLSLFGAATNDPVNPATSIEPVVAVIPSVLVSEVEHQEYEHPAPGNHPHWSQWAGVRLVKVESSPCQIHQDFVVDRVPQQRQAPAPWHEALAVPALTAARTPAALQVFRS